VIVDGHAHVTEDGYGSPELLAAQMAQANIDRAVLVPGGMIDVRKMTRYITGGEPIHAPAIPNQLVERLIRQRPEKFLGFYCVNPHEGDAAVAEFELAVRRGFRGLKLAPLVHRFSLTSRTVLDLAAACGALGVPLYTHVVYHPGACTEKMGLLAGQFSGTVFILGHMGFGPADMDAIELAARHDNLFLETSGGSYLILKAALERLGPGKLIFGSEFPLHHPQVELEKLDLLLRGPAFEQVTSTNMLALVA